MDIQHIKQIPITDYLQQQCYTPTRVQGIHYWYCSPLRNEGTPSFKVNTERNQWYDFGTGEHGDIIDLVCTLQHCTMNKAIELLTGSKQILHQDFSFGGERKTSKYKLEIISVQSLTNPYLLRYIAERGISLSIANRFCPEIRYNNTNRTYYAIGFSNDAGGWEIRSPYFKGCIAPKAITTISKGTDVLQIFEGFMDFLSWQTLNPSSTCDTIVLNSLALLPRIQEKIKSHKQVESFLDNDDAGQKSFEVLKHFCPSIIDGSVRYRTHKDINEWLIAQSKMKEKQPLLLTTKRGIRR
ncbi:MAG: CHC2 zinc finger domain-containing protein [Segatella oulorum]